jgi:glycosyltransferase involved in cell wall biosynthesis
MQKKIKIAAECGKVTIIYWKRSAVAFKSGLSDSVLEIPVAASFVNNKGFCRIVAFMIFALKSWSLLRRIQKVKKVYVNYLDVLLVACLRFGKKDIDFIYAVGDLASVQYGGHSLITGAVKYLEKMLMKRVSVLILSSPFFWSEYYDHVYQGRWELIENMPEKKIWGNFRSKQYRKPCVVGYIGWIRDCKPIQCLLAAVKELREEGYDIQIFFAGFGPDNEEVKRVAADLDFVSFYGHYQYDTDAPNLYSRVDIIFSVYDISVKNAKILLPNRFYECIICGLPIIVAKETKLEAYMNKYGIGYSVDYLSAGDVKDALISHINCNVRAMQIKQALNSVDKSQFFYDRYYPVLADIFKINLKSG